MNPPGKNYITLPGGARIYERIADMPPETQAEMIRDAKIYGREQARRDHADDRPDFDFERDMGEAE